MVVRGVGVGVGVGLSEYSNKQYFLYLSVSIIYLLPFIFVFGDVCIDFILSSCMHTVFEEGFGELNTHF